MKRLEGIILNVVVAIVGSMLGGWLISPLRGAGTINQNDFSLPGLVSFIGAMILLAIVNCDLRSDPHLDSMRLADGQLGRRACLVRRSLGDMKAGCVAVRRPW